MAAARAPTNGGVAAKKTKRRAVFLGFRGVATELPAAVATNRHKYAGEKAPDGAVGSIHPRHRTTLQFRVAPGNPRALLPRTLDTFRNGSLSGTSNGGWRRRRLVRLPNARWDRPSSARRGRRSGAHAHGGRVEEHPIDRVDGTADLIELGPNAVEATYGIAACHARRVGWYRRRRAASRGPVRLRVTSFSTMRSLRRLQWKRGLNVC